MIDVKSPDHPYMQIAKQLRDGIASGEYDGPLPSVKAIARETGVATGTVNHAYEILKEEGLVYSVPGRGMFVRKDAAGG